MLQQRIGGLILFLGVCLFLTLPVSHAQKQKPKTPPPTEESPDTIKIDVQLVNVPVIASDRNDVYVADLKKEEFTLTEDGKPQELVFFSAIKEPFHVVLMIDTSGSTEAKLKQIQQAAQDFVAQLQPADRIKIIAFDDGINDMTPFTNDRDALNAAIRKTRAGQGTKLYDAMKFALNAIQNKQGRKAIVLLSDGVDSYSDVTKYDDNIEQLEEAGVIVYPIRYDTRRDTEASIRMQQEDQGTITLGGGPPLGQTPSTIPGGRSPVPTSRPGGRDPYGLPIPPIILPAPRTRYPNDPNRMPPGGGRYPDDRYPDSRYPDDRLPDASRNPRLPNDPPNDPNNPTSRRDPRQAGRLPRPDDNISVMLDGMYRTASLYMNELASASGGQLHYAEDLRSVPEAFAKIADALRNQYSLGYYPANGAKDGKYHKIIVRTTRRNVVIRARPGYRAPKG